MRSTPSKTSKTRAGNRSKNSGQGGQRGPWTRRRLRLVPVPRRSRTHAPCAGRSSGRYATARTTRSRSAGSMRQAPEGGSSQLSRTGPPWQRPCHSKAPRMHPGRRRDTRSRAPRHAWPTRTTRHRSGLRGWAPLWPDRPFAAAPRRPKNPTPWLERPRRTPVAAGRPAGAAGRIARERAAASRPASPPLAAVERAVVTARAPVTPQIATAALNPRCEFEAPTTAPPLRQASPLKGLARGLGPAAEEPRLGALTLLRTAPEQGAGLSQRGAPSVRALPSALAAPSRRGGPVRGGGTPGGGGA